MPGQQLRDLLWVHGFQQVRFAALRQKLSIFHLEESCRMRESRSITPGMHSGLLTRNTFTTRVRTGLAEFDDCKLGEENRPAIR